MIDAAPPPGTVPDPDDPVLRGCRALAHAMGTFDEAACRALGVGRSDLRALNLLEHGPRTATALAEHLGLTKPAITALVDRLEVAGYVRRTPDPADRRARQIELRPAVWEAFASVYRPLGHCVVAASRGLAVDERARLARHLHQLADAYAETAGSLSAIRVEAG
jgi:DNA-binding MarR family transcriptional regulator